MLNPGSAPAVRILSYYLVPKWLFQDIYGTDLKDIEEITNLKELFGFISQGTLACGNPDLGVFVMSMEEYLQNFFEDQSDLHDLYNSLATLLAESQDAGEMTKPHG